MHSPAANKNGPVIPTPPVLLLGLTQRQHTIYIPEMPAEFLLSKVEVENFRCIKSMTVALGKTTFIIGENNTGKTAFLDAIHCCLDQLRGPTSSVFTAFDYHLDGPTAAPGGAPIRIRLQFAAAAPSEDVSSAPAWDSESSNAPAQWPSTIQAALDGLMWFSARGDHGLTLELRSTFNPELGESTANWSFLNAHGDPISENNASDLRRLRKVLRSFHLGALRDAGYHFSRKGLYWRPFLTEAGIEPKERDEVKRALQELNDRVVQAHGPLRAVREHLETSKRVMEFGEGESVSINALPTRLFSILAGSEVHLKNRSGSHIPLRHQGEGSQSLAVLLIFRAFLEKTVAEQLDAPLNVLTALEEPEAHLHTSAIRALLQVVKELPGQKLVSTHSGDILDPDDFSSIRRFAFGKGGLQCHQIDTSQFDKAQLTKLKTFVRDRRSDLLFARCWALVEGESEVLVLGKVAQCLEVDLHREGISLVPTAQSSTEALIRCAEGLGISWVLLIDDDRSGHNKYARAAQRASTLPSDDLPIHTCEHGLEGQLFVSGFRSPYIELSQETQKHIAADIEEEPDKHLRQLLKGQNKPNLAAEAVKEMTKDTVPPVFRHLLEGACGAARFGQ